MVGLTCSISFPHPSSSRPCTRGDGPRALRSSSSTMVSSSQRLPCGLPAPFLQTDIDSCPPFPLQHMAALPVPFCDRRSVLTRCGPSSAFPSVYKGTRAAACDPRDVNSSQTSRLWHRVRTTASSFKSHELFDNRISSATPLASRRRARQRCSVAWRGDAAAGTAAGGSVTSQPEETRAAAFRPNDAWRRADRGWGDPPAGRWALRRQFPSDGGKTLSASRGRQ